VKFKTSPSYWSVLIRHIQLLSTYNPSVVVNFIIEAQKINQ